MDELERCPFCGGGAKINEYFNAATFSVWAIVSCTQCGATQPTAKHYSKAEAISAWNRRADRWIPCSEPPEREGHVLIFSRDVYGGYAVDITAYTHVGVGGIRLKERQWMEPYECFFKHSTITHWQPIPQPPRKENDHA